MGHLGHSAFNKWKKGIRLTKQQQIYAHYYECNGQEQSGEDCGGLKSCPLYPYSPSAKRRGFKEGYVPSTNKEK